MKNILLFLMFLLTACHQKEDSDTYFHAINDEIHHIDKAIIPNSVKLKKKQAVYQRELKKYNSTRDTRYLISSKYAQTFLEHNPSKQVPMVYELLKINNDQYDYISIACNFNLALRFEDHSPTLALQFLDKAISIEEKTGKKYFMPHLYHIKGRWYYKRLDYKKALYYFEKALKNYKKEDKLFIASMYNNFGMTYNELKQLRQALQNTEKGISVLENIPRLNDEEIYFLNLMRQNLGSYYLKEKNYADAEVSLLKSLEFFKNNLKYENDLVKGTQLLSELYDENNKTQEKSRLIDYLTRTEQQLHSTQNKILVNEALRNYYFDTHNLKKLEPVFQRLTLLNHDNIRQSINDHNKLSDILDCNSIESINQKYEYEISFKEKENWLLLIIICISIISALAIIKNIRNKNKSRMYAFEKQKILLERDAQLYKEKIKNLHLTLNLKMETEKAFLENLKKIKRSRNVDIEEVLKNLLRKIHNLIHIDKNNYDLINESSFENELFIEKLLDKFPFLTSQELKMCVYFKLNLSSNEISTLENIAPGTARVYKTKIKSKLGLKTDEDLSGFLNSLN